MERDVDSSEAMQILGRRIGEVCRGGELIELIGDIGAGKTTLTKGIAFGMGVTDEVQSPTFTLSRTYETPNGIVLAHYDFYRLNDPGILSAEIADAARSATVTVVIEWANVISHVLPEDRLSVTIIASAEDGRQVRLKAGGPKSHRLMEALK